MGRTISDIHKEIYFKWRREGLTHEQAIDRVNPVFRKQFEEDVNLSNIESHFGVKPKTFYMIMGGFAILLLTTILIVAIIN